MSGTRSVLVADDEEDDIALISAALTRRGYTVITATDGREAVRAHAWHPEKIDLLVTDIAMAPMNGLELAALLMTAQQDLKVLFVSGYVGEDVLLRRKQAIPGALFLRKPFTSDQLLGKVGEALNDGPPIRALSVPGNSGLGVG
jgi:two-component system, cell cycle sensor histidine kinase and response regulator CckA